jgi:hypothetical protein
MLKRRTMTVESNDSFQHEKLATNLDLASTSFFYPLEMDFFSRASYFDSVWGEKIMYVSKRRKLATFL